MNEEEKSIHKTLDQTRAKAAWAVVSEARDCLGDDFGKYASLVKGFPADIINNGLGQSMAFLFSNAKNSFSRKTEYKPEGHLLLHLMKWLTRSDLNTGADIPCYAPVYDKDFEESDPKFLIRCIWEEDSTTYMRATLEALSFLDYLRRFATGISQHGSDSTGAGA